MSKIAYLYGAFLTVLGAILYRIRGGLDPALPRPFDQLLVGLPFGAIAYKASGNDWRWFVVIMILTTVAFATGHGQYMDLGRVNYPVEPETLDFFVRIWFGDDTFDSFWRDAYGLALTGLVTTLPCGLALCALRKFQLGTFIILSGLLKFPAYLLGWEIFDNTEAGEYITGAFLWGTATITYMSLND